MRYEDKLRVTVQLMVDVLTSEAEAQILPTGTQEITKEQRYKFKAEVVKSLAHIYRTV